MLGTELVLGTELHGLTDGLLVRRTETADKNKPEALAEFVRNAKRSASASGSWIRKLTLSAVPDRAEHAEKSR